MTTPNTLTTTVSVCLPASCVAPLIANRLFGLGYYVKGLICLHLNIAVVFVIGTDLSDSCELLMLFGLDTLHHAASLGTSILCVCLYTLSQKQLASPIKQSNDITNHNNSFMFFFFFSPKCMKRGCQQREHICV